MFHLLSIDISDCPKIKYSESRTSMRFCMFDTRILIVRAAVSYIGLSSDIAVSVLDYKAQQRTLRLLSVVAAKPAA